MNGNSRKKREKVNPDQANIFGIWLTYRCPHCDSPVTFSQLGHAHRWGWCPMCRHGLDLNKLPLLRCFERKDLAYYRKFYREHKRNVHLSWLHYLNKDLNKKRGR